MKYFFILGHQPELSLAEIKSVLHPLTDFRIEFISPDFCLVQTEKKINLTSIQNILGGTIKTGEIITEFKENQISKNLFSSLFSRVFSSLDNDSKINFGFSLYGSGKEISKLQFWEKRIKSWSLDFKKNLQKQGLSARWVSSKERFLSSVILQKNKILEKGFEVVFLFNSQGKVWGGRTISCQNFRTYEIFDFKRPARNIKRGMIPLRLAKIMINLADIKKDFSQVILDPFCGFGTILQEAAFLGYSNLIGSDQDLEAVQGTKDNLDWMQSQGFIFKSNVFQADVRNLSQKIKPKSIDFIISEPYLGPLKINNWAKEVKEISSLYLAAFQEFFHILKPRGRICIIFPVFKKNQKAHFLPILKEIKNLGYDLVSLDNSSQRGSLIYSRPSQTVQREIFLWTQSSRFSPLKTVQKRDVK
jgi:tRNA G10  N-methylase Trm11